MLSGTGSGGANEIFRYDSSGIFQVTDDADRDEYPQINDNGKIVWRGDDSSHFFYYDGSNTTNISDGACSGVGKGAQINSNGDVVWVGVSLDGGGDSEIFLYDGTATKQLTDNAYGDWAPHINENGQVVYVGQAGPSSAREEIFLYDGFASIRLTNNSVYDYQPDINKDGHLVWSHQTTDGYEIFYYDGSNIIPIANFKGGSGQPKISDNGFVAWQGVDPNNSTDNKIFVWDGLTTTVLDSNATNDRYHQINANGDVVWAAHDGKDFEIFLARRITESDTDEDGIPDSEDECPDTVIPESVPTKRLGTNRFALVDDDTVFDTKSPKGKGPQEPFTIEDTAGCSCEQIIEELGLGKGHIKFGCSIGVMREWVDSVNP